MYIEALRRQLSVCSFEGAARLIASDKDYWHVISICGPHDRRAVLPRAKSIYYAWFDDVEDPASEHSRPPRDTDIAGMLGFIAELDSREPGSPLMIHCQQGISRSAAIAVSLIYSGLPDTGHRSRKAVDLLLKVRPQAKPNRLVLTLSLAHLLGMAEALKAAQQVLSDPRIQKNQFRSDEAL